MLVKRNRRSFMTLGSLYCPRKSSVPYRVHLDVLQILWLLANPFLAHGIGESGLKNDFPLVMWVQQIPIRSGGFIPTPLMDHCCTHAYYLNSLAGSYGTLSRMT